MSKAVWGYISVYNILKLELVYVYSLKVFIKLWCIKAFSKSYGDNKVSRFMKLFLANFKMLDVSEFQIHFIVPVIFCALGLVFSVLKK